MTKPPFYYPLMIRLAMPLYRLMVYKKSHHLPTYEREISERFGKRYLPIPQGTPPVDNDKDPVDNLIFSDKNTKYAKGVIWCHAVSLGELNTAYPVLKNLLNQGFNLWITSTTQTGFNRASTLFANELGVSVNHSFVPVDNLAVVARFLAHVRPVMALFVETELWATMLSQLANQGIPSVMINARLTQKSYEGYARFGKLSQSMMQNLTAIIAQDNQSAQRFRWLGADLNKLVIADSLKWSSFGRFDDKQQAVLDESKTWQMSDAWGKRRAIWVAASTHEGEERLALLAHQRLLEQDGHALLILVPRHPERFDDVARLCDEMGFVTKRRSRGEPITPDAQVYLADSLGELLAWYALGDVALVAGSLVDKGGHNPIEPAALGKPIIMGKFDKNCQLLTEHLSAVGALVQVPSSDESLALAVGKWLFCPQEAQRAGRAGADLVAKKQHAAQIQTSLVLQLLGDDKALGVR